LEEILTGQPKVIIASFIREIEKLREQHKETEETTQEHGEEPTPNLVPSIPHPSKSKETVEVNCEFCHRKRRKHSRNHGPGKCKHCDAADDDCVLHERHALPSASAQEAKKPKKSPKKELSEILKVPHVEAKPSLIDQKAEELIKAHPDLYDSASGKCRALGQVFSEMHHYKGIFSHNALIFSSGRIAAKGPAGTDSKRDSRKKSPRRGSA
jgi:hypothetical protein